MPRYKRHGSERGKQHCARCGREAILGDNGMCKRCRRDDKPRPLVATDHQQELDGINSVADRI